MQMTMPFKRGIAGIKPWEELTISDNFIFQAVMRKKRCCKRFIESVLGIKVRKITYPVITEKDIKVRRESKGVRLDVYVEDDQGNIYDIEMQTTDYSSPEELPKRSRYYQAMIDLDVLNKGHLYKDLRKTYILFICTFDPFDRSRGMYTFYETCAEDTTLNMGDETAKIFLNSKGSREGLNKDLVAFLDYVEGKAPQGRFVRELDEAVIRAKENKEMKVEYMTYEMELRRREEMGREEGRAEGRAEGVFSALASLVRKNLLSLSDAAKEAGLSVEEFRKMAML